MSERSVHDSGRRKLVVGAGAGLAVSVTGLRLIELARAKPDDEPVDGSVRWGMLIDTSKCAEGCDACVTGCNEEHGLEGAGRPATDAQWIRKLTINDPASERVTSLPMLCQHCEDPPCVAVCPTGASFKREDGVVLVDKHTCIGCRYCMMACPYKARSFIHEDLHDQRPWSPRGKGTVESCTFCVHRVDRDESPACVEACNRDGNGAMTFGDLHDPQSEVSTAMKAGEEQEVRADLGLNTAVRYRNL